MFDLVRHHDHGSGHVSGHDGEIAEDIDGLRYEVFDVEDLSTHHLLFLWSRQVSDHSIHVVCLPDLHEVRF